MRGVASEGKLRVLDTRVYIGPGKTMTCMQVQEEHTSKNTVVTLCTTANERERDNAQSSIHIYLDVELFATTFGSHTYLVRVF